MSVDSGTLTRLLVHPTSPVLLTKNGPLGTLAFRVRLQVEQAGPLTHLKFENRLRLFRPKTSNHSLYLIKLPTGSSYPEGNFGGNQLLDGSISLSPLYPNLTIDLHVRIAASFHQSFLWLRPIQAQFTIFRVATGALSLKSRRGAARDRSTMRPSHGRKGLQPQQAANCLPPLSLRPSGLPPKDSHVCCTPWSVFQDRSDAAIRTPTTSARGLTQLPAGKRTGSVRRPTDARWPTRLPARREGPRPPHRSHRRDR